MRTKKQKLEKKIWQFMQTNLPLTSLKMLT
nr:MAG TPA: hypothetical protein [Caudoviricetes sp.]